MTAGARTHRSDRLDQIAGLMVVAVGLFALGTAFYLRFLRPPMLPEDVRFTGVRVDALPPEFSRWLAIVFHTWGGFVAAFGLLLVTVGIHLVRPAPRLLRGGVALALLIAFGGFLASNLELRSDFLPALAAIAAVAGATVVALLVTARASRSARR